MYKILLFSGGVYKFELLSEHVDDVGGLLIQENRLQISRGSSFLSEEVRVMLILPPNEVSSIKSLANDIKGKIEEVELEETLQNNLIKSLEIYDILCKANNWLNIESIIKLIEFESEHGLMGIYHDSREINVLLMKNEDVTCQKLEECLELMISLELLDKRKNNDVFEYRISKDDKLP